MRLTLSSRRNFLRLMGIGLGLAVLANSNLSVLAQNTGAWVARHGMTSSGYQSEFNKYTSQGYRPVVVSGYAVGNQARYAALLVKTPNSPSWVARHGMTSSGYQSEFNKYTSKGYRPVQVSGYSINNQDYYAALFEKTPNAPAWVARHGLTSAQYQAEFNKYTAQGYRPVDVSGYTVNNQDYYAVIFEKTPNAPAWVARHGMTSSEYQSEFNKYVDQGYRLMKVSGYSLNDQDRYAALWEKVQSPAWVARHGMTSSEYQSEFDKYVGQGYRLVWVNGYTVSGQDRYAAIWRKS